MGTKIKGQASAVFTLAIAAAVATLTPAAAHAFGTKSNYNPTNPPQDLSTIVNKLDPTFEGAKKFVDESYGDNLIAARTEAINQLFFQDFTPTTMDRLQNILSHQMNYQLIYGPDGIANQKACNGSGDTSCQFNTTGLDVSGTPGINLVYSSNVPSQPSGQNNIVPIAAQLRFPQNGSYSIQAQIAARDHLWNAGPFGDLNVSGNLGLGVGFHAEATQNLDGNVPATGGGTLPNNTSAPPWDGIPELKPYIFQNFGVNVDTVSLSITPTNALSDIAFGIIEFIGWTIGYGNILNIVADFDHIFTGKWPSYITVGSGNIPISSEPTVNNLLNHVADNNLQTVQQLLGFAASSLAQLLAQQIAKEAGPFQYINYLGITGFDAASSGQPPAYGNEHVQMQAPTGPQLAGNPSPPPAAPTALLQAVTMASNVLTFHRTPPVSSENPYIQLNGTPVDSSYKYPPSGSVPSGPGVPGGLTVWNDYDFVDVVFVPDGQSNCDFSGSDLSKDSSLSQSQYPCNQFLNHAARMASNMFNTSPFNSNSALFRLWYANVLLPRTKAELTTVEGPITTLLTSMAVGFGYAQAYQQAQAQGPPASDAIPATPPKELGLNAQTTLGQIKSIISVIQTLTTEASKVVKDQSSLSGLTNVLSTIQNYNGNANMPIWYYDASVGPSTWSGSSGSTTTLTSYATQICNTLGSLPGGIPIPPNLVSECNSAVNQVTAALPPGNAALSGGFPASLNPTQTQLYEMYYVGLMSAAFAPTNNSLGFVSASAAGLAQMLNAQLPSTSDYGISTIPRVTYNFSTLASYMEAWPRWLNKNPDVTVVMTDDSALNGQATPYTLADMVQMSLNPPAAPPYPAVTTTTPDFYSNLREFGKTRVIGALEVESIDSSVADATSIFYSGAGPGYMGSNPIFANVSTNAQQWNVAPFNVANGIPGSHWSKGIYHPYSSCRMGADATQGFCPVCTAEINNRLNTHTSRANSYNMGTMQNCQPVNSPETGSLVIQCSN